MPRADNLNVFNEKGDTSQTAETDSHRASHGSVDTTRTFLTAEWRDVVMLNYQVDPALLNNYVPSGTELDVWQGKSFISLVGFRFLNTKVWGIPIPFHRDFDEINLRFYVQRREGGEVRRGVVFVREIVPRRAVATIARLAYNEQYVTRRMSHRLEGNQTAQYSWVGRRDRGELSISVTGDPAFPAEGSEEQFIAEHYWGYSAQRDGGCIEYRVEHPSWRVWRAHNASFTGDVEELYGRDLAAIVKNPPTSAFLAEGSRVRVFCGTRLVQLEHSKKLAL